MNSDYWLECTRGMDTAWIKIQAVDNADAIARVEGLTDNTFVKAASQLRLLDKWVGEVVMVWHPDWGIKRAR